MSEMLPAPKMQPKAPANPGNGPDGGEARAKADELKTKDAKAKADLAKDGKPVQGEGLKPVNITVPAIPSPKAASKGAAPTGKEAAPKGKPDMKKAGSPKPGSGAEGGKPAKGPAASAAQASVDGEVTEYLAKAPHDKSKEETHGSVGQLSDAAKNLAANCPPAQKADGAGMAAAKMFVPGMDMVGAKKLGDSDLGKMWSGASGAENPYASFNSKLGKWCQVLSRVRDIASGLSSILGKIGMVLTVVGLVISLTGIGAPLGAPIATIGRVLGIITLVLDAITFVLSTILMALTAAMLKSETDPAKRKLLAERFLDESAQSTGALVSVAMALPGLGKLAGMAAGGAMKIVKGIATKLGKLIGKVGMGAIKGIAKRLAQVWSKLKGLFKGSGKVAKPGALGKAFGQVKDFGKKAWQGTKDVASKAWTGTKKLASDGWGKVKKLLPAAKAGKPKGMVGKAIDKVKAVGKSIKSGEWIEKLNKNLEGKMAKFGESKAGKAFQKMDEASLKFNAKLDKWTGKELLEKGENALNYGFSKLGAAADKKADSLVKKMGGEATEGAETAAAKDIAKGEEKGIVQNYKDQSKSAITHQEEKIAADVAAKEKQILDQAKRDADQLAAQKGGLDKNYNEAAALEKKHASGKISEKKYENQKAALEEKISEKEARLAATNEKVQLSQEKAAEIKHQRAEKMDASASDGRAKQRLDEARGVDKDGKPLKELTDEEKKALGGWKKELDDAVEFKDPAKTSIGGQYTEKIGDPMARSNLKKDLKEDYNEGLNNEASDAAREQAHGAAEVATAQVEAAQPAQEQQEAGGGAAPHIAELDAGDGGGGLTDRVHNLVGNLDPQGSKVQKKEPKGKAKGQKPAQSAEPPKDDAPKPTADGEKKDEGGGADEGAGPEPGTVPYWPELLDEYRTDLKKLDSTESDLHKYREAQISGYKAALGLKDQAKSEKEKAAGRKTGQQANKKDAQSDQGELKNVASQSDKSAGEATKGDSEKGKGSAAGDQGAAAAGTPVPEPPAPHWWDRIINAIKGFLVKYISKGLKYIQDAIANAVLKTFCNMSLEEVNQTAHGMGKQAGTDGKTAKESEDKTGKSEAADEASKAKADSEMSEAEKLYASTTANVKSADELLGAIADLKKLLNQELTQGAQFISDLKAAKETEKKDLQTKAEKQAAKEKEGADKDQAAADEAAKDQKGDGGSDGAGKEDEDKDEADPAQFAMVKQAASIVAAASSEYHTRVVKGFGAAKGALVNEAGGAKVDKQHAATALTAFEQAGGEVVSSSEKKASDRVAKLGQITSKGSVASGELSSLAQEVEQAAQDTDEGLKSSLGELKADFDAAYEYEHRPADQPNGVPAGVSPTGDVAYA